MDEHVLPVFTLDKAKSFGCIEPFHCTCFFHGCLYSGDLRPTHRCQTSKLAQSTCSGFLRSLSNVAHSRPVHLGQCQIRALRRLTGRQSVERHRSAFASSLGLPCELIAFTMFL